MSFPRRLAIGRRFGSFLLLSTACITHNEPAGAQDRPRTVHAFVVLADNAHQGIVPVPAPLGNGEDAAKNLYWGAAFGVRTYFRKTGEWKELSHKTKQKPPIALMGPNGKPIQLNPSPELSVYIGHDGLMDFSIEQSFRGDLNSNREAVILACASKAFFGLTLRPTGAHPLIWTTGLMAPEAYTLKAALDGWMAGESGEQIRQRVAKIYAQYQKISLISAQRLFSSGW